MHDGPKIHSSAINGLIHAEWDRVNGLAGTQEAKEQALFNYVRIIVSGLDVKQVLAIGQRRARLVGRTPGLIVFKFINGCCVDGACDEHTCMKLPDVNCGECNHFKKCEKLIKARGDRTSCDWFPRRYVGGTR